MEMKTVFPRPIDGKLQAPPSKSYTQRAIAAAGLARGVTVLENPSDSADAHAALEIIEGMGAFVERDGIGSLSITGRRRLSRIISTPVPLG